MNNLGYLLLMQGDFGRAIETCREAARRFDELGMRDEGASAAENVALGLLRLGDDEAALGADFREPGHVRRARRERRRLVLPRCRGSGDAPSR